MAGTVVASVSVLVDQHATRAAYSNRRHSSVCRRSNVSERRAGQDRAWENAERARGTTTLCQRGVGAMQRGAARAKREAAAQRGRRGRVCASGEAVLALGGRQLRRDGYGSMGERESLAAAARVHPFLRVAVQGPRAQASQTRRCSGAVARPANGGPGRRALIRCCPWPSPAGSRSVHAACSEETHHGQDALHHGCGATLPPPLAVQRPLRGGSTASHAEAVVDHRHARTVAPSPSSSTDRTCRYADPHLLVRSKPS
jgi:hypothetical protein